jgi:hypothetical protein
LDLGWVGLGLGLGLDWVWLYWVGYGSDTHLFAKTRLECVAYDMYRFISLAHNMHRLRRE